MVQDLRLHPLQVSDYYTTSRMARNLLCTVVMHRVFRTVITRCVVLGAALASCGTAFGEESAGFSVPLEQQSSGAFYIRGTLGASVDTELLVDTGSSYVVLSRATFKAVEKSQGASFKRTIQGATASGKVVKAKVYEVSALSIGDDCVLESVEVVVLPGSKRDILGLSALKRVQPFTFDLDPLALRFEGCRQPIDPIDPIEDSILASTSDR